MADKNSIITEIIAAQRQLQRSFADDRSNPLFTAQLTMSQLKMMMILHNHGPSGGQELTRFMGVSLATLTGIVDRLVAQDFVTRKEDPTDRRIRRIDLTDQGRATIDGIITAGTERMRQLLSKIAVDDLCVIQQAMKIMGTAIAESGIDPAGGRCDR